MICLIVMGILIILTTTICIITDWLEGLCINVAWIIILIVYLIVGWTTSVHTPEMEMIKRT